MDGATLATRRWAAPPFKLQLDAVEGIDSSSGWMRLLSAAGPQGHKYPHAFGCERFPRFVLRVVRNSAFDARNYFDHSTLAYPGRIPPFRRNEFDSPMAAPLHPSSLRRA